MKNKMLKPEMEFIEFGTQDVITTSGEGGDLQMNFGDPVKTSTPGPDSPAEKKGYGGWTGFNDTTAGDGLFGYKQ